MDNNGLDNSKDKVSVQLYPKIFDKDNAMSSNTSELKTIITEVESIHQESAPQDQNAISVDINTKNLKLMKSSSEASKIFDDNSQSEMENQIISSDQENELDNFNKKTTDESVRRSNVDLVEPIDKSTRKRPKPPFIFRCEICLEEFENDNMLKEHLDTHDFQFCCKTCNAKFTLAMDYIDHVREHRSDKMYKCAFCEFTTEKRHKITSHLQNNHEHFRKYRCKKCNIGFNVYNHFLDHAFIHSNQKPFKCDQCESAYSQRYVLKQHKYKMHTKNSVPCDVCSKVCPNKHLLYVHKKAHEFISCEECGMRINKYVLKSHIRVHRGEEPYICSICGKRFRYKVTLKRHQKQCIGKQN